MSKAKTRVVNLYREGCDVYIARSTLGTVSYVPGGKGYFGNPFKIGEDGTREEVIAKYREYFKVRLTDKSFVKALEKLRGKRLGCFCAPLACHGDVIVEYLEGGK